MTPRTIRHATGTTIAQTLAAGLILPAVVLLAALLMEIVR